MDASALIPSPEAIPAPWWFFESLSILGFIAHILAINIVLGGTLIAIARALLPGDGPELRFRDAQSIPTVLALGINLGVAPFLFMQTLYGTLLYTSSVLMAVYWISIIPLLIISYYGLYLHAGMKRRRIALCAGVVSGIILLYIAFVFVNNMSLMLHVEKWSAYFAHRGGGILNLSEPTLPARYLHFLCASVAVAGLFSAIMARRRAGRCEGPAQDIRPGLKIFAWATLAQIIVGLWYLASLPGGVRNELLGGSMLRTAPLLAGMLFGISAFILALRGRINATVICLLCTVVFMAVTRANLRALYLKGIFDVKELVLSPQYGALALFLVAGVFAAWAIRRMIKMLPSAGGGGGAR